MEHDSVLVLESGPDSRLQRFTAYVTAAGLAAVLISPLNLSLKVPACMACLLGYFYIRRQRRADGHARLLLFSDGRARWLRPDACWQEGMIASRAWSSGCYAVVTGLSISGPQHFLICRSKQQAGHYRILMAWLRLKSGHETTNQ